MTAAAVLEHISYCPRERRRVARSRTNLDHMEAVRAARVAFLRSHLGRIPRWTPGEGLRTVTK